MRAACGVGKGQATGAGDRAAAWHYIKSFIQNRSVGTEVSVENGKTGGTFPREKAAKPPSDHDRALNALSVRCRRRDDLGGRFHEKPGKSAA